MTGELTFRRVVVSQGTISGHDRTIDVAVRLAASVSASLKGIFVEESKLLDLADLPFSTALVPGGAGPRNLDRGELEDAFLREAARLRQELATRARDMRLQWEFAARRGEVVATLASECRVGDVIVLAGQSEAITTADALAALRSVPQSAAGVLLAPGGSGRAEGPLLVIDEGGAAGLRMHELGRQIAAGLGRSLVMIEHGVRRGETGAGGVRYATMTVADLVRTLSHLRPWGVMAELGGQLFRDQAIGRDLLRASGAPLLLMRAQDRPAAERPDEAS